MVDSRRNLCAGQDKTDAIFFWFLVRDKREELKETRGLGRQRPETETSDRVERDSSLLPWARFRLGYNMIARGRFGEQDQESS